MSNIRPTHNTLPPHLFHQAVEQAHVAILITDLQENILYTNPAFKRFSPTDAGLMFLETIKQTIGQKWQQLRANNGLFKDQEMCFKPGGYQHPRWFICTGKWIVICENNAHQQKYLLLTAKEITTLKRQQEEVHLNALRALLAEEELTEEMRETLAGAIHQLQVPINLITAALSLLKRRTGKKGTDEPLSTALQQTLDSVNCAVEQLRHCLPPSENTYEPAVAPVNLNELIRDILTIYTQRLLAEGVMVDWQPALVLPSMLGQVKRLRGMFKQLIDNSINSMRGTHGQRELRIVTTSAPGLIKVIIEDTGKGIPKHLRFRIFEPFFTTGKGAGMGLAVVQEIVNLHAGTLSIDPDYTQGSRFIIQFPRASRLI